MNNRVRVLFASANPGVLHRMARATAGEPGVVVVAQAGNAIEATALSNSLRPDVVVVDAELPHVSASKSLRLSRIGGLDAALIICRHLPKTRVVVLSGADAALGDTALDDGNVALYQYRETTGGSSRIKLAALDGVSQGNQLVFAGMVVTPVEPVKRKVMDFTLKTVPLSVLGIMAGLALMLIVIQPIAGLGLAMIGGVGLFVSLAIRTVAARWHGSSAIGLESADGETEKAEDETHALETRTKTMPRV